MNELLNEYLDKECPLQIPLEISIESENLKKFYEEQAKYQREIISKHWIAGYMSAFTLGNEAPNSMLKVSGRDK